MKTMSSGAGDMFMKKKSSGAEAISVFTTAPQPCGWKQDAKGISFLYFSHNISSFSTFVLSFRN